MASRIFLTGPPRVGKTTVLRRVMEELRNRGVPMLGFITEEVRDKGERIGFDLVEPGGRREMFARKGLESPDRLGPYGLILENLDSVCRRAANQLPAASQQSLIVVDEIGAMELRSAMFREFVLAAVESPRSLLAVVQLKPSVFVDEVKRQPDVDVLRVRKENRDALPAQILERLARDRFITSNLPRFAFSQTGL